MRKASVSLVNITPGQETISYLESVVKAASILGGILLCLILFFYDVVKDLIHGSFLNQLNVSSFIIVVGVVYEVQKSVRSLYKTNVDDIEEEQLKQL